MKEKEKDKEGCKKEETQNFISLQRDFRNRVSNVSQKELKSKNFKSN